MKICFIICLLTVIVSQHHCDQVESYSYSHINRQRLFEMERHRKSVYCSRACNGYLLVGCPGERTHFSSLSCLCSKSVKRIRNSDCWTQDHQPPGKNMQKRFKSCREKCRSEVADRNIYAALCSPTQQKKPPNLIVRDCFCVTFTKMPPRPPKDSEGDNIDEYEEEDDFEEIEDTVNICSIV